jgi:hypothetical protein
VTGQILFDRDVTLAQAPNAKKSRKRELNDQNKISSRGFNPNWTAVTIPTI